MADVIGVDGIGQLRVTYNGSGSELAFDPTVPNGNARAGRMAVTITGSLSVQASPIDARIHGMMVQVQSDGKVVVAVKGYMKLSKGDSPVTIGTTLVGDELAGVDGYVKTFDAVQADTVAFPNVGMNEVISVNSTANLDVLF